MITLSGIISYLILFLGLCLLVVIFIASYNIINRSYQPFNAFLILIPIYLVLILCAFFGAINYINVISNLQDQNYDILVTF